jgi:hypothetical protein
MDDRRLSLGFGEESKAAVADFSEQATWIDLGLLTWGYGLPHYGLRRDTHWSSPLNSNFRVRQRGRGAIVHILELQIYLGHHTAVTAPSFESLNYFQLKPAWSSIAHWPQ